jgi:hypothetical protein
LMQYRHYLYDYFIAIDFDNLLIGLGGTARKL